MTHARTQIRSAIKTILDAGVNSWQMVHAGRIQTKRQAWPYLMVFSDSQTDVVATVHSPNIYERETAVVIIGMLKVVGAGDTAGTAVEDSIDSLCAEVETKLTATALRAAIPGKNLTINLSNSAFTVVVDEDDAVSHAEATMSFTIRYFTQEGAPEVLL